MLQALSTQLLLRAGELQHQCLQSATTLQMVSSKSLSDFHSLKNAHGTLECLPCNLRAQSIAPDLSDSALRAGGVGHEEGGAGRQVDLVCPAPRSRHWLEPGQPYSNRHISLKILHT